MAGMLPTFTSKFIILSLLSFFATLFVAGENHGFFRSLDRKLLGLHKEKLSHLRFYWHDIQSGRNPTSIPILPPLSNSSTTSFGVLYMIDDALTVAANITSKLTGRAQGFYALASQEEVGLLMTMNFVFIDGKYNGSTITVLGRNPILKKSREMVVIGGSGLFRFARGYVQLKTSKFNRTTGDAIVEYNAYALHY